MMRNERIAMKKPELVKLHEEIVSLNIWATELNERNAALKHEVESKNQVIQMQSANYGALQKENKVLRDKIASHEAELEEIKYRFRSACGAIELLATASSPGLKR
jgi:hypothetical protein